MPTVSKQSFQTPGESPDNAPSDFERDWLAAAGDLAELVRRANASGWPPKASEAVLWGALSVHLIEKQYADAPGGTRRQRFNSAIEEFFTTASAFGAFVAVEDEGRGTPAWLRAAKPFLTRLIAASFKVQPDAGGGAAKI